MFCTEAFDCIGEPDLRLHVLIAGNSHAPWDRLSDIGEDVVGIFMLLLFVTCIVAVIRLGIQEMLPHRHKRAKHKRRKFQERSA